jgi:hypothetical protein
MRVIVRGSKQRSWLRSAGTDDTTGSHFLRFSIRWSALALLTIVAPTTMPGRASPRLGQEDRVRIAEARRLANEVSEQVWPGWGKTPFSILLVSDSVEFLIGRERAPNDFSSLGYDQMLRSEVWVRRRQFPPTLLATFPFAGVPTTVIGSAERTGKSSTAWVLTLLHEHFHQWQYSEPGYYAGVTRLDLAQGDTTGQWMLNYPFPYDSAAVPQSIQSLAAALVGVFKTSAGDRQIAWREAAAARDSLRSHLRAADYRYFEFQLWQEGVARFIEYAVARTAARAQEPAREFRALPDYEPYGAAADRQLSDWRRELEHLDAGRQRRVAFYPIGAALALLLEQSSPGWKHTYAQQPFVLAAQLSTPLHRSGHGGHSVPR